MAINLENTNISTSGTSLSITVSGSNTLLLVGVMTSNGDTSTCTANSTSMTAGSIVNNGWGWSFRYYYLINPPSGSVSVSANGTGAFKAIAASVFSGAGQITQPDSYNTNNVVSSQSLSLTTTVVKSNCWLWGFALANKRNTTGNQSAGSSTTIRQTGGVGFSNNAGSIGLYDSNGTVGNGSQTLNCYSNDASTEQFQGLIISIAEFSTDLNPSIVDSVTLSESVSLSLLLDNLYIMIDETVSITEGLPSFLENSLFTVFDIVSLTEELSLNLILYNCFPFVSDTVSVSDEVQILAISTITGYDNISCTDSLENVKKIELITVYEDIQVTDILQITRFTYRPRTAVNPYNELSGISVYAPRGVL